MKPIIVICGLSGSGKTFSSKILEKELENYKVIGPGIKRQQLGITHYSRKDTPKLLAKIIEEIENNQDPEQGFILDANLKSVDLRQSFYDLAKHLNINLVIIETFCSDETATKRMARRERPTLAENPTESIIYHNQKRVWQDILLDFDLNENKHVSFIKFDSENEKARLIRENEQNTPLVSQIIKIMEKGQL